MKKCILCGLIHVNGCDKSEWDGVLKQKFNVPVEHIEDEALKEEEHNHIVKRRGRPRRNG